MLLLKVSFISNMNLFIQFEADFPDSIVASTKLIPFQIINFDANLVFD